MGGKSRKSGGVSKKLIMRLKAGKGSCNTTSKKVQNEENRPKPLL